MMYKPVIILSKVNKIPRDPEYKQLQISVACCVICSLQKVTRGHCDEMCDKGRGY